MGSRKCRFSIAFCTRIARGNRVLNAHTHLSVSFPVIDFGISQAPGGSSATAPSYPEVVHTVPPFGSTYCPISTANILRSRRFSRRLPGRRNVNTGSLMNASASAAATFGTASAAAVRTSIGLNAAIICSVRRPIGRPLHDPLKGIGPMIESERRIRFDRLHRRLDAGAARLRPMSYGSPAPSIPEQHPPATREAV